MRVGNGNGWAVICSKAYINWINLQITALMAAMKHAVLLQVTSISEHKQILPASANFNQEGSRAQRHPHRIRLQKKQSII
jgi:hypothetical protein